MEFRISWIDKVVKEQFIEAENEEEAKKKFFNGECNDYKTLEADYLEESLDIEEQENDRVKEIRKQFENGDISETQMLDNIYAVENEFGEEKDEESEGEHLN